MNCKRSIAETSFLLGRKKNEKESSFIITRRPTIVMTTIMSINGTLQLFDESVNLTKGGPANATITMSHYIYNGSFGEGVANFGYASAMSVIVFIMVAILAFINLKVGDKRD